MRKRLSNTFLGYFWITFALTVFSTLLAFVLLSVASRWIAGELAKNRYSARSVIQADYRKIDASEIVANGGGVQIIDKNYTVIYSVGIDTIHKNQLTVEEFTELLTESKNKPYHYDIEYEPTGEFWLIVTFPTSIRFDFALVYNKEASRSDFYRSLSVLIGVGLFYLVLLSVISYIYARLTSSQITVPLKKLTQGTLSLREGDYSARVDLHLKNEFKDLQDTFNEMAARIEEEITLRKLAEENRRRLILDISHDLKNPLTSIGGYAEVLKDKYDIPELQAIYQNSRRASFMLNELFELSQIDSPDFTLKKVKTELCETMRLIIGEIIPQLESAEFAYEFDIPDSDIFVLLNQGQFKRVIHNLIDNAIRYNPKGTLISINLSINEENAEIRVADNGVGIPLNLTKELFTPFVHRNTAEDSNRFGSGLGLSIAKKIVQAHGGDLVLEPTERGTSFLITVPQI